MSKSISKIFTFVQTVIRSGELDLMSGLASRQVDRWMDGWMDGWMDELLRVNLD